MIAAIINRLDGLNADGVETLFAFLNFVYSRERWMASTTPERIAELDAIEAHHKLEKEQEKERATKEAGQIAEANRKQIYLDYARMFHAIDSVDIPTRYDLEIGEMVAIDSVCGGVRQHFPEYAFSVAGKYFKYGFVKGMRYAKARAKRKEAKKKQIHRMLSEEKPNQKEQIRLPVERIERFLPKGYTTRQKEDTIIKLLSEWQRKRERLRDEPTR